MVAVPPKSLFPNHVPLPWYEPGCVYLHTHNHTHLSMDHRAPIFQTGCENASDVPMQLMVRLFLSPLEKMGQAASQD